MMPLQQLDPTDAAYGLTGDGTPNTQAAFQSLLDAANSAGIPAHFGPGEFVIDVPSTNSSEQYNAFGPGTTVVEGAGADLTTIRICPDSPPAGYFSALARLNAAGGKVRLSDFTLAGPRTWDMSTNPHINGNGEWTTATAVGLELRGATGDVEVRLERIRTEGYLTYAITFDDTPTGKVLLLIDDCDLYAYGGTFGMGANASDTGNREVLITRTRFHGGGIPAAQAGGKEWNHILYCNPAVKTTIAYSSFENCEGNLQWYSNRNVDPVAGMVTLLCCTVAATVLGSLITPPGAQILGGAYNNGQGIELAAGSLISGAKLNCPVNNGFAGGDPVFVSSSTLLNLFSLNIVGGYATLSGCNAQRGVLKSSGQQLAPAVAPTGGTTFVEACTLFAGDMRLTGADRKPATAAIAPRGNAIVLVRGGMSVGDYGFYGSGHGSMMIGNLEPGETPTIDADGHTFDMPVLPDLGPTDPQPAMHCDGSAPPNSIQARNCRFLNGCMPFSVATPQHVEVRPGISPTPVASAPITNLLDGFNFATFHVTGTAAIGQITVSNFEHLDYRQYNQRCLVGRITLIADGAFSLVPGTGVGALALDSALTMTPGESITLEHDPAALTWRVVG